MDIRQVVHITLADQAPKIIDGYWHEWVDGEWINTGVKAEVKDGSNYLIFGFWMNNVQYKLSDAGIPVVKIPDSTATKYSVYKLTAPVSTLGSFIPDQWELVESADFIYMQDAYIEHLQATMVTAKTLRTDSEGARTEIDTEGIKVFNALSIMNIRFGLKNGYAVMEYYDNDGELLYDLGPSGIGKVEVREESWTEVKLHLLSTSLFESGYIEALSKTETYKNGASYPTTYYRYNSKIVAGLDQDPINNGKVFPSRDKTGIAIKGIFCRATNGYFRGIAGGAYPADYHPNNPTIQWTSLYNVWKQPLVEYLGGVIQGERYSAYWTIIRDGYGEI